MRSGVFVICLLFILALGLVGCPHAPEKITTNVNNSPGANVAVGTGGSGVGTAPCAGGAGTTRNPQGDNQAGGTGQVNIAPDCGTTTTNAAPIALHVTGAPSPTAPSLADLLAEIGGRP